jgi:hypothetical protein
MIAAPLGSIALLLPIRTPDRRAGAWSATRRLVLAVVGTVVLIVLVGVVLKLLLGVNRHNLIVGIAGVAAASVIWLRQPARARAQRAAGDGQADAPLAAAPELPAVRDRGDRRQHRRRVTLAPG